MCGLYSSHSTVRLTPGRFISRTSDAQPGSNRRRVPGLGPLAANSRSARTSSVSSSANGQVRPAAAARGRYSLTVLRLTPSSRAIAGALTPIPSCSRSNSRIHRVVSLCAGICSPSNRSRE
jgi:hypothetical protein